MLSTMKTIVTVLMTLLLVISVLAYICLGESFLSDYSNTQKGSTTRKRMRNRMIVLNAAFILLFGLLMTGINLIG